MVGSTRICPGQKCNGSVGMKVSCITMMVLPTIIAFLVDCPLGTTAATPTWSRYEYLRTPSSADEDGLSFVNFPTHGPIEDAMCNIEDLEKANDSQLHSILQEIKETAFFRSFVVDLEKKCPLALWSTTTTSKKPTTKHNEDTSKNGSETTDKTQKDNENEEDNENENNNNTDEDEFECTGGADELDDDAEPLCAVQSGQDQNYNPFGMPFSSTASTSKAQESQQPTISFESNALFSISQDGFQSKAQEDTFSWKQHSDKIVDKNKLASDEANSATTTTAATKPSSSSLSSSLESTDDPSLSSPNDDCHDLNNNDQGPMLPDSFWVDLCLPFHDNNDNDRSHNYKSPSNVVDLTLNPERNTGYNGTHIWRAIYEENCIVLDDNDDFDQNQQEMCFEERVLYRLLSGLHTSTTISIAVNYYPPSKRKGRPDWEPNPTYFMGKFQHHPERIRNLHFSYVVLLRALQKASAFLYDYEIRTGDIVQDETASVLLHRLLDSAILKSCSSVFSAFDESLMFQQGEDDKSEKQLLRQQRPNDVVLLQQNFKGVFHNISSILDCVQCQQCKLHGKMAMLGYGTALKILFMRNDYPDLNRNEIVALINTIAKFSESIRHVRELTHLYWQQQEDAKNAFDSALTGGSPISGSSSHNMDSATSMPKGNAPQQSSPSGVAVLSLDSVDNAVAMVADLGLQGMIQLDREEELVQMALAKQPELLILAKHYRHQANKFLRFSSSLGQLGGRIGAPEPDAIVVGTGLAGLAATLTILDRGGRVILIEKERRIGGNSNKASSGINACCPEGSADSADSIDVFRNDTTRSAGSSAKPDLIDVLVQNSAKAVEWLRTRVGVDLSLTAQLGGHSAKRTHRPSTGMAGAEIIYGLQRVIKKLEKSGSDQIQIKLNTKATRLLTEDGRVVGVECVASQDDQTDVTTTVYRAPTVILATGGFASDRTPGSYLDKYRPELKQMPTTAGPFSKGEGISMAMELNAGLVDMEHVQIHPTAWVDPTDPNNTSKVLAAELLRGVGGLLFNETGDRFCNELGTRAYVTDKMLAHDPYYAQTQQWKENATVPSFFLILSEESATSAQKHVDLYTNKGLMQRFDGITALAKWMKAPKQNVANTLKQYQNAAIKGIDAFGKKVFKGVVQDRDFEKSTFFAGKVTPAIHYCMGGITIDDQGRVLNGEGQVIQGLYAAGEVSGGVHGQNRLAGNSLLECTVFGTRVGEQIPIRTAPPQQGRLQTKRPEMVAPEKKVSRIITPAELEKHNTAEDCWVAVHGAVYDLTGFAEEHPAGAESIWKLAGTDGTAEFAAVHNINLLDEEFSEDKVGVLLSSDRSIEKQTTVGDDMVSVLTPPAVVSSSSSSSSSSVF